MLKNIKTLTGFELELDDEVFNDMELFESTVKLEKGDMTELPGFVDKVMGKETKKRFYDHLRTDTGRVPMQTAMDEIRFIIESLGDSKKN